MWRRSKDRQAAFDRHGERRAALGRALETEIESLLADMKDKGELSVFTRFAPHSVEDGQGKDFMVGKEGEDGVVRRFFGVTISLHSWNEVKCRHPEVPQLCFPIGTKPETMRRRILELFDPP